jgi:hypothetical protein
MNDFDNVERRMTCVSVSDLEIQLSSLQISQILTILQPLNKNVMK